MLRDEVLEALREHGRFPGVGLPAELRRPSVRTLAMSNIRACPHLILSPEHYREDGSCRCDDGRRR